MLNEIVFNFAVACSCGMFNEILLTASKAFNPEILIVATADLPIGVASANMVSFILFIYIYGK